MINSCFFHVKTDPSDSDCCLLSHSGKNTQVIFHSRSLILPRETVCRKITISPVFTQIRLCPTESRAARSGNPSLRPWPWDMDSIAAAGLNFNSRSDRMGRNMDAAFRWSSFTAWLKHSEWVLRFKYQLVWSEGGSEWNLRDERRIKNAVCTGRNAQSQLFSFPLFKFQFVTGTAEDFSQDSWISIRILRFTLSAFGILEQL